MLEERTFYFSETQVAEMVAVPSRAEVVKAILSREGVDVEHFLGVDWPEHKGDLVPVRVLVPVVSKDELVREVLQRFMDMPIPPPDLLDEEGDN